MILCVVVFLFFHRVLADLTICVFVDFFGDSVCSYVGCLRATTGVCWIKCVMRVDTTGVLVASPWFAFSVS